MVLNIIRKLSGEYSASVKSDFQNILINIIKSSWNRIFDNITT